MRHAYKSGAKTAKPPVSLGTSLGFPGEGTPATVPGAYWVDSVTTEMVTVIEEAGITPGSAQDQLRDAILALITARINAVIGGAPGALDTLNELAAALGDDANFATTVNNAIALRALINSPVFTGDPRVPAVPSNANARRIADKGYVDAAVGARLFLTDLSATNVGTPVSHVDTGTLFSLSDDFDNYNFLRISYRITGGSSTYDSVLIPTVVIPAVRNMTTVFRISEASVRVTFWGTGPNLRLERLEPNTDIFRILALWGVDPV